jgi:tetratricopeptide (TPR) repeat protein
VQVQGLETKVPPTSAEFEHIGGDLQKIAAAYGVDAFVLSSVTAQADRFVLNIELVEARNRRLLWSKEYEGARGNYLELVQEAGEKLRQELRPAPHPVSVLPLSATTSDAELAFQRGLYHSNRFNHLHRKEEFDSAFSAFQDALKLDPKLADAAAGIGLLYWWKFEAGGPHEEAAELESERWARRALELNRRCARAWSIIAILEEARVPHRDMAKLLATALHTVYLGPRDAMANSVVGGALSHVSCALSLEPFREASRLDPLYLYPLADRAVDLECLGRREEALEVLDGVLRLEPEMAYALVHKCLVLIGVGRDQEATELLKRLDGLTADGRSPREYYTFTRDLAVATSMDKLASKAALGRLLEVARGGNRFLEWDVVTSLAAPTLARRVGAETALRVLTSIDEAGGIPPYDLLMLNPDLVELRTDPRFVRIAARSRAQFQETVKILKNASASDELPAYLEKPLSDVLNQLGFPWVS